MAYSNVEFEHACEGTVIARITLETDESDMQTVEFRHESGNSELGAALAARLCKILTSQMAQAKKGAYDRGFHEGRNTRRKKSRPAKDFWGDLDPSGA